MRGIGFICDTPDRRRRSRCWRSTGTALRNPVAVSDAGMLFYDDDAARAPPRRLASDHDHRGGRYGLQPAAARRPFSLTIAYTTVAPAAGIPLAGPVRASRPWSSACTPRRSSRGSARSPSAAAEWPPAGPRAAGKRGRWPDLTYLDNSDAVTDRRAEDVSAPLTVIGLSNQAIAGTAAPPRRASSRIR